MVHALEIKIDERKVELVRVTDDLRRLSDERIRLEAEIAAYKDSLLYLEPGKIKRNKTTTSSRIKRGMSEHWRSILKVASNSGRDEFDIDVVVRAGLSVGYGLKTNSVRSQLAGFVNRDWLERTKPGKFRLAPDGAKELEVVLHDTEGNPPNENEPPKGGSDTDEGATSSNDRTDISLF